MHVYGELTGTLTAPEKLSGVLSTTGTIEGKLTIPSALMPPSYDGEHEITPGESEQTLETSGSYLENNIIIKPIPSNYGHITWDGSKLTIT